MKEVNILLIEDNEGDIVLLKEAFEESKLIHSISIIKDGKEAIRYFEHLKKNEAKPNLVLLDINLPKVSGFDVLKYIRKHENFRSIPVIILTTSSLETDIVRSYENCANCFITKPIEIADYFNAMSVMEDFWINIVSVPNN
jgi:CheY-like chemotaxis protein